MDTSATASALAAVPAIGGTSHAVDAGKTLTNNMDLLDLWKCHICREPITSFSSYLYR